MSIPPDDERSKGGQYMAKKKWYSFGFYFEVALECPGDIDEHEAAEDAASFADMLAHAVARVGDSSYASVIRVDECGHLRPGKFPVVVNGTKPTGRFVEAKMPRGITDRKDFYERPVTKAKQKKKITRRI